MKKVINFSKIILLLLVGLLFSQPINAQCPYDKVLYAADFTPEKGATIKKACVYPGEYLITNVVEGETYLFWGSCDVGNDDIMFTLYNKSGTTVLATADDEYCKNQPLIRWTANFTGAVHLLTNYWDGATACSSTSSCNQINVHRQGIEKNPLDGNLILNELDLDIINGKVSACLADAGTQTLYINGLPATSPLILCKDDCFDIITDSNYVLPPALPGEIAQLMYAIYDGVPNLALEPDFDPNFVGSFWTGDSFDDCNDPTSIIQGAGLGSTVWFVPITMDDGDSDGLGGPNKVIHYDNDGDGCWVMGTPIQITYLESIIGNAVENCVTGTTTITLQGGFPTYSPSGNYTVSNTGAGTMVQSGAQGQILTFSGYTPGQTLSVAVSDDGNGCPATVTFLAGCLGCLADAGTQTLLLNGNPTTSPILVCKDDCFDIITDSNFVLPPPLPGEDSELMYAIYDGVPNLALEPDLDPNFTGFFWTGDTFDDCNDANSPVLGVIGSSHVWFVAITMDDGDNNGNSNNKINYDNDGDGCWAMGTPIEIVYLESIEGTAAETCTETVITLSGGFPGYDPTGAYVILNVGAGSIVQSGAQGEIVTVTGYLLGETISIQVTNDGNSCAKLINHKTTVIPTITLDSITNIKCNSGNIGAVNVTLTGGDTLPCTYTLNMYDAYGDGWNGGSLNVLVNGVSIGAYSVSPVAGSSSSATIIVPNGQSIELIYTPQNYEEDNSYELILNGSIIFSDGIFPAAGSVFTTSCAGLPRVYPYAWSNGAVSEDINGLAQGSYTLSVTNPLGCVSTSGPHIVTEESGVTATIASSTNILCNAAATTGSASVTGSGGTGVYTYLWTNGATTTSVTGLVANTYCVTVTDALSCSGSVCVTISEPAVVTATITASTNASCLGATGAATAGGSGGAGTYTYNWSIGGQTTATVTGLTAGIYTVTVQDLNSCSATTSVTITQASAISVTASVNSNYNGVGVSCFGALDGSVLATVNGGAPIFSYVWSNGQTTALATGLAAGAQRVTVTDGGGCTATSNSVTVTFPGTLALSVDTIASVVCAGSNNGFINISVSGGTGTIAYNWSNGATVQDITGLVDGTYTVTATDANACTTTGSMLVETIGLIEVKVDTAFHVTCHGESTGSIYTSATGDTTVTNCSSNTVVLNEIMYRPILENGQNPITGEYIELLGPPGMNIGCYVLTDGDWTITIPPGTIIPADGIFSIGNDSIWGTGTFDLDAINCACFTEGSGGSSLLILTDGGEFVALYDGAGVFQQGVIYGSPTVGNTPSGTNMNTVGTAGCVASVFIPTAASFETAPAGFIPGTSIVRNPDGTGAWVPQVGGSLNACNVSGANTSTGAVTYIWTNGATTKNVTGLAAGSYTVTATNAYGCSATTSYTITEPTAITATIASSTSVTCNGNNDGSATVAAAGGTGAFTYNWSSGGQTTSTATGLVAGTYYVTVADVNNCMVVDSIIINEFPAVVLTPITSTNILCNGGNDGAISVVGSGGTGNYTYLWASGQTDAAITGLTANTYMVTVSDDNNCMDSITMTITQPTVLAIVIDSVHIPSCGLVDGAVFSSTSGGTGIYTYLWSNAGETTASLLGVPSGTYSVTVIDENSCMDTISVSINELGGVVVTLDTVIHVTCNGGNTGSILVTGSGGTAPYSYNWSNGGGTTETITGLSAGSYAVTISDFGGCFNIINNIVVNDGTFITATVASSTAALCNGTATGTATALGAGGTATYTYLWNIGGQTTATATGLANGTYYVTVNDANNCTDSASIVITQPTAITATVSSTTTVTCKGGNNGTATIAPNGGTVAGNYAYNWGSNAANQTTQTATGLKAGNYFVTVTDDNACSVTSLVTIIQDSILIAYSQTPAGCTGIADGTVTASPMGANGGFSYLWGVNAANQTTSTATGLSGGVYFVTVTDALGCTATAIGLFVGSGTSVDSADVPLVVLAETVDCDLNPIGALGVNTNNTYTYLWSNGATTKNATGLGVGNYTVTISNTSGCTWEQSGTILSPSVPSVKPYIDSINKLSTTVGTGVTVVIDGGNNQAGVSYVWETNSNTPIIGNNTSHSTSVYADEVGSYVLTITATSNTSGCTDTGTVILNVASNFIGMPNAFSPNGDGENELYRPLGLSANDIQVFKVFNRWGQLVYEGSNLEGNGWDGKYLNAEQPSDVYLYVLQYKLGNAEPLTIRGELTLVR